MKILIHSCWYGDGKLVNGELWLDVKVGAAGFTRTGDWRLIVPNPVLPETTTHIKAPVLDRDGGSVCGYEYPNGAVCGRRWRECAEAPPLGGPMVLGVEAGEVEKPRLVASISYDVDHNGNWGQFIAVSWPCRLVEVVRLPRYEREEVV